MAQGIDLFEGHDRLAVFLLKRLDVMGEHARVGPTAAGLDEFSRDPGLDRVGPKGTPEYVHGVLDLAFDAGALHQPAHILAEAVVPHGDSFLGDPQTMVVVGPLVQIPEHRRLGFFREGDDSLFLALTEDHPDLAAVPIDVRPIQRRQLVGADTRADQKPQDALPAGA